MSYPGGKNGAGVFQTIINAMPAHRLYCEPFLGGGAVMRAKRPALINVGLDRSAAAIAGFAGIPREIRALIKPDRPRFRIERGCGIAFLEGFRARGDELFYLDPPYLLETRSAGRKIYRYELSRQDHRRLLRAARGLECAVIISGYRSSLYDEILSTWRSFDYVAGTRGGPRTETLWLNFPAPVDLHDWRYAGADFRQREMIKRKRARWLARLARMSALERGVLLSAIREYDRGLQDPPAGNGGAA